MMYRLTGIFRAFSLSHRFPATVADVFARMETHPPAKNLVTTKAAKLWATANGITKQMNASQVNRNTHLTPKSSMRGRTRIEKRPPPIAQDVTGQYECGKEASDMPNSLLIASCATVMIVPFIMVMKVVNEAKMVNVHFWRRDQL